MSTRSMIGKSKTVKKTQETIAKVTRASSSMFLLQVSISRLGNTRKGDVDEIQSSADKELLRVTKRLLVCDEFTAIQSLDIQVTNWVRARSVPSLFKEGIYHVRPEASAVLDAYLKERATEREKFVEAFKKVYARQRDVDRRKLSKQFRDQDYPEPEILDRYFSLSWRFFTMGPPQDLKDLNPELYNREKDRISRLLDEARQEGLALIRTGFKELVDHMIERLKPSKDGTKKRFHETNVTKIVEFIEAFELRNVGNDEQLKTLLVKTRKLLRGIDVEMIRKDEDFKGDILNKFKLVKKYTDALVQDAPARRIDPNAF